MSKMARKEARGEMESAHNLKLSTNRAKEVKKVLVMLGIDEKRIKTIGYGFTRPRVFPQKNSDDAQQNRRIEVKRISPEEVREVEPHVRCVGGIKVLSTGIVSYKQVCLKYAELIQQQGGELRLNTKVEKIINSDKINHL